jgi:predicted dehydrogenase
MASKIFNVGVVGYGMSANVFHIPFIVSTPGLRLYAVVQRHPTTDKDARNDHPGIKSYRSVEDLTKDPAVDVVVITTTPEVHYAQAKLALEAGKHVLLEKPATPTAEELESLIEIAKKHNVKLCIYQSNPVQ